MLHIALPLIACLSAASGLQKGEVLEWMDVFELEYASDPRISPEGNEVVYVRNSMDVMRDRAVANLWRINADGTDHRPLVSGNSSASSPRWSPDGERLAYAASVDGKTQLFVRWMDTDQTAQITRLTESPGGLVWSPDGAWLAFTMRAPDPPEPMVTLPSAPKGAQWAPAPKLITEMIYRGDGRGYLKDGHVQVFVVPSEGGSARQLTSGAFDHGGRLAWTADGKRLIFSANRNGNHEMRPRESELYVLSIADGMVHQLTDRRGPDQAPTVSPDGKWLAYVGHDETYHGSQNDDLYVMPIDGGESRCLTASLDRSVSAPIWTSRGALFVRYDDQGRGRIARVSLDGEIELIVSDLGGTSLGRPYPGGSFTANGEGVAAFTRSRPDRPADVALVGGSGGELVLTDLNGDLLDHKELGQVHERWVESSFDGRKIQAWVVTPPGFDPAQQYPLVLEIHGGPFANYGPRFASEIQLFAAAGYVVLYTNPRGSTSYGQEFANLIHHAYPGNDFDDLMSCVDAVIEEGYVDPERLYVTGGSGGGVLTAWIVGKTDRFKAAVVAKPVINWISFALTSDAYNYYHRYWFSALPWQDFEQYWRRSPLSLVGDVKTPTMLLTGEADYRTPISESEQFYQALKLAGVDTAFVRVPEASHGISARPSRLIAKVAYVLAWFERHP